jgi:2-isopropylmalate synthase
LTVFDWNRVDPPRSWLRPGVTFLDETLRDGIQNPSVTDPDTRDKLELIHSMNDVGIHTVNVGLPAASRRSYEDALAACREIVDSGLRIRPVAAARTVTSDVEPILEIAQRAGIAVEVYTFVGSSPIRWFVESWDIAGLIESSARAIDLVVREGLSVCYVTEDTTRSRPAVLSALWKAAIERGAKRICLTDTVGHATKEGVKALVAFAKSTMLSAGAGDIGIDWHGHNDRGLALDNAISALERGADRIHGTALGIGERAGNTPMELLLHNLFLHRELEGAGPAGLARYCETAARALRWDAPPGHPLL